MGNKIYSLMGKEYTARLRSFKPYRLKVILLQEKFESFETEYISAIQKDIQEYLLKDKTVKSLIVTAGKGAESSELNEAVLNFVSENPEFALKLNKLESKKQLAKELFLTSDCQGNYSDDNVKELCEIMLEDASGIDHNPQSKEDYEAYDVFINELWNDFFLNRKN